jgi:hypothetical protein
MLSIPGIISQNNGLTDYDKLILSDNPLIYFPLHKNSQSQSSVTGLWGYKNYANGFQFDSYTYSSLPDISTEPTIVNGASSANIFTQDSVISIPKSLSSTLNLHINKSIEFWFKLTDFSPICFFADGYTSNTSQVYVGLNIPEIRNDNRIFIGRKVNTTISHWVIVAPLELNTIYHAVFSYSNTIYMYLNGSLARTVHLGGSLALNKGTGTLYIGRGYDGNDIATTLADQPMSNFAIYDRVLTAAEVLEHYNAGVIV